MELEHDQQRRTYQLCRLGFFILSLALVLACLTAVVGLARNFGGQGLVAWLAGTPFWRWLDVPIVWGSLVGTYLLWGRWSDIGWQRRSGLLVLMGTIDVVLWFLEHGESLGLRLEHVGHLWLRQHLGEALGWSEFALIASLAGDLLAHLGVEQAPEAGKATRSLAGTGAVVWMLLFCQLTNWNQGWPLEGGRIHSLETLLLYLGSTMIWTITLIQSTALSIAATRQLTRVLAEMEHDDRELDLLRSPSESGLDLPHAHRDELAGHP